MPAFRRGQAQARYHDREVPAHFLLCRFAKQARQGRFVWLQQSCLLSGYLLGCIGRAHSDTRVGVPQTLDHVSDLFGLKPDLRDDFIHASNGPAISFGKDGSYGRLDSHKNRCRQP